ncbi:hypothetical protein BVC80_1769g13 [Macleaya cordata]|uniref:Uncharacterized protein n=1 Tax=Macleaya cordata TaxID=56857 RepID=A0A200QTJ1_MACCD|nr:hypothetical protein BVC80_1769g13 [Macleaya cordata]
MAVSAFKSTSKRGNPGTTSNPTSSSAREGNSEDLGKAGIHRRSRSISALSRTSSSSSIVDFLNKRDNPLFCSTSSSPPDLLESESLNRVAKFDQKESKFNVSPTKSEGNCVSDNRRGRSVIRNSETGNKFGGASKELGRSLSTVDRGRGLSTVDRGRGLSTIDRGRGLSTVDAGRRRRSVSRGRYENSEKKANNVSSSASERSNRAKTPQTWSSQHPHSEPSDGFSPCVQALEWEDGISTSSFSEAEEKTIKAVSEQMKSFEGDHPAGDAGTGGIYETVRSEVRRAISEIQNDLENVIQRKNPSIIATTNVSDIPPELVNPDAIELVSEIRREYASKLQQSQERARKLRADLAVEEHRGQELSRILEEILPEPKTVPTQKSRPRRKNSVERWKMSKRLTEEAMNYFDECVSISTFDSSDFSSPEDQPVSLPAAAPPVSDNKFLPSTSSSASANYCVNGHISHNKESDDQVQSTFSRQGSDSMARSNTKEPIRDEDKVIDRDTTSTRNFQFSFAREPTEAVAIHNDIRNYIKKFEKEIKKDGRDCKAVRSNYYDADDYEELQVLDERFLFDRVILKSRIESGGLHLCATGITF